MIDLSQRGCDIGTYMPVHLFAALGAAKIPSTSSCCRPQTLPKWGEQLRQKSICSLGDLGPRPREEWLKLARKIDAALLGQADLLETDDPEVVNILGQVRARQEAAERKSNRPANDALISVDTTRVTAERHREAGTVHVGYQFWQRLHLDTILEELGLAQSVRQLACAMTLNRLIAPASEHAMPAWIRSTALDDILGIDFEDLEEDPLYQVLDKLHPHRFAIEAALVKRERSLFNLDTSIYLYDLTSSYFEGICAANGKAKRGYSRDQRPDCKQIVVGLVINRDGFPIAHEILAGNTQESEYSCHHARPVERTDRIT